MISYPTKQAACPVCGSPLDHATPVLHEAAPAPGDVTICFSCGQCLEFTPDAQLRALSPAEILALPHEVFETLRLAMEVVWSKKVRGDDLHSNGAGGKRVGPRD